MLLWKIIITSMFSIGFSTLLFIRGRNYIVMMLAVEMIFLGLALMFYCFYMSHPFHHMNHDMLFAAFAMLILAAAESAVALALISVLYKKKKSIVVRRK